MNRKVIFIILAALVFALIMGLAWFWLFSGKGAVPANTGTFGSSQNKPNSTNTSGASGGNSSSVTPAGGGNTAGNGTNNSNGNGGSSSGGTITGNNGSSIDYAGSGGAIGGIASVPGVDWVGGGGGGGGGGQTISYVPSTINQLNNGGSGGTVGLIGSFGDTNINKGNSDLGLVGLVGGAAGCALLGAFRGSGETQALGEKAIALSEGAVLVFDWRVNAKQATPQYKDFGDCIMRTIAKAVLQQITSSIVNWINSGFNGKPSFVTNFNQFFTNVGDQAAGEFIRGTGLSFLCSPFQLKIRIALAQSYARRNAQSCTLTSVIKNIDKFMTGSFSQGGWGGLLQFTTIPTNNLFGAFAYAQVGLQTAQSNARNDAQSNLSAGGFISLRKCIPPDSKNPNDCKVTTPGVIIEGTLVKSLSIGQEQLAQMGVNGSFDAIISALLTQLTTKVLYQGLSTLSGQSGYASNYLTPEQQKAQDDAQALLNQMQGYLQVAQQYGSAQQGSISDIQNAQNKLSTLANCWETASSSASHTESQRATARVNADNALAALHSYDAQIGAYNANITRANTGIAKLQELQTLVLGVTSAADVAAVKTAYDNALASGAIITSADVTTAQQDRSALQSRLASRNQQTESELNQCYAF